jgi:hypothetical protein
MQVGTNKGFQFRDQAHYDKLADAVLRYVGKLLVDEAGLVPIALPLDATEGEPKTVVFVSEGIEKAQKVLVVIQGSGRVRVGVWGCALCINKDLDQGTMLPYLRTAAEQGYGVLVLNPNENGTYGRPIRGSETPQRHVAYAWKAVVQGRCLPGAVIDVVAHSNGGMCLIDFLSCADEESDTQALSTDAAARIRRVVFTDSYHDARMLPLEDLPPAVRSALADRTRYVNYVPHPAPLGTPVDSWISLGHQMTQRDKGCQCLSAAVEDHAATNQAVLQAAFEFFAK